MRKVGLVVVVVTTLAAESMSMASSASAAGRPKFHITARPGYCGTAVYPPGASEGISISRASDPWKPAKHLTCKKARAIASDYTGWWLRSAGAPSTSLRIDGYKCSVESESRTDETGHVGACTSSKTGDRLSVDWAISTKNVYTQSCTASGLAATSRKYDLIKGDAYLIDHRCGYAWAAARIRIGNHVYRYGFYEEDGNWNPVRLSTAQLDGNRVAQGILSAPINCLGRAMAHDGNVEHYRI